MIDDRECQENEAQRRLDETRDAAREVRSKLEESLRLLDRALSEENGRVPVVPQMKGWRWPWNR